VFRTPPPVIVSEITDGAAPVAYAVTNAPAIAALSLEPGALPVNGSQLLAVVPVVR